MKFEDVLPAYREGKKIGREIWVGSPLYTYHNKEVLLSHNDLFEDDWRILDEPKPPKKLAPCIYVYGKPDQFAVSGKLFSSVEDAVENCGIVVQWPALPDANGFYSVEQE